MPKCDFNKVAKNGCFWNNQLIGNKYKQTNISLSGRYHIKIAK